TVHLVSISVDPEKDSVPALRLYADQHGADHDHWWFLTGERDKIYNYAYNELHVVMGREEEGIDKFIHTQKLVLLDKDRHIRGYYDGIDTAELRRCADDIILLTLEKKRKRRR
ncbi:MAG: SCO family protein, partial [Taibaiella sp.]|nr:SCO family protein [Taibaiella sp.]